MPNIVTDLLRSTSPKEAVVDRLQSLSNAEVTCQRMIMHGLKNQELSVLGVGDHNATIFPPQTFSI